MAAVVDLVVALARQKDGRLFIQNRRAFDEAVAKLPDQWELELTLKRLRATRSLQQNRYYFGAVIASLVELTGYTPDEMHDLLKAKFIPKQMAICDGNGVVVDEFVLGGSTREMNTEQFGEYLESIRQWAAETLDLVIPDPDECYEPPAPMKVDSTSKTT